MFVLFVLNSKLCIFCIIEISRWQQYCSFPCIFSRDFAISVILPVSILYKKYKKYKKYRMHGPGPGQRVAGCPKPAALTVHSQAEKNYRPQPWTMKSKLILHESTLVV